MEVHHHLQTPRKKWTHYFWEFFMLFLAVTAGFFIENQREHYIENKRAKAYARLLIDDLAVDTAELNKAQKVWTNIITAGDSLTRLLNNKDINNIPGGKLYYYEYWSGWSWNVISRNATFQQLTSSGAMRYMGDTSLIRKLLAYEEAIKIIYLLQEKYAPEKTENWKLVQKVFDQAYFDTLETIKLAARDSTRLLYNTEPGVVAFLNRDYPLITYDKNILMELKNWAHTSCRNYRMLSKSIISTKQRAVDVIEALKKEYHLE